MKLRYKLAGGLLIVLAAGVAALALAISYTADCEPSPPAAGDAAGMRAVVYRCYGPPEVLRVESIEKPVPEAGEVLVQVKAAAVNPLDWHYMRGSPYFMRLFAGIGRPEITRLGVDYSGVIEAVGDGVTRFRPGDEVFGGRTGAFAEYVTAGEDRAIAPKPPNVSFEQAAAVPIAGVTALQALRDHGKLQAGQEVLINGASGGVGTFAVQIAKALGAEVTGVCSTRNVELVRGIGADHVVDYKKEDYTENGRRYDLIVDLVGNHSVLKNRKVLKPGGTLVIVGGPKGDWFAPLKPVMETMAVSPFVDEEIVGFIAQLRPEDLATLAEMMRTGRLTPVLDRKYPLAEVAEAVRYSEAGHARGKIIIDVD